MEKFGFLIFLLVVAILDSIIPVNLSVVAILVLFNFTPIKTLLWWVFLTGFTLDLLLGNFLGINSVILVLMIIIWQFGKNFLWPNLTYEVFPKQLMTVTLLQVVITIRLFDLFYNLLNFGMTLVNFDLKVITSEIILTLLLFSPIAFLSQHLISKRQLELKF